MAEGSRSADFPAVFDESACDFLASEAGKWALFPGLYEGYFTFGRVSKFC